MVEISGELHFMSASHTPRRRVEYSNVGYDHIVRYLQWSSGGQALSKIEKSAKSCNVLAILSTIGYEEFEEKYEEFEDKLWRNTSIHSFFLFFLKHK